MTKHHLLFSRGAWTSNRHALRLRTSEGLHHEVGQFTHEQLHANVPEVPLMSSLLLNKVYYDYEDDPDTHIAVARFKECVISAASHPRVKDIEREVASLTLKALTMQLPYLRRG